MDHRLYLKDPGIYKNKNNYYFNKTNKPVTSVTSLNRLNVIKVPPAWTSVWYSSNPRCHVQVTGVDSIGKKQYILSDEWTLNSKYTKYLRMKSFIQRLPSFKKKIKLDNSLNLIYLLFNLLIDTHIRVGNEKYAEKNKTYGLTTLRQKHLVLTDDVFSFSFVGKSKIHHSIKIPSEYNVYMKKLILPNKNSPLFWHTVCGKIKEISSEELNIFLKENMGKDYTCKDFRTYSANILFIKAFLKFSKKETNVKKIILKSIEESAKSLGHSEIISKKSYISNTLLDYCVDSFTNAVTLSTGELLSKA